MVKLDVLEFYLAQLFLGLEFFLVFGYFEPRCSYKIVLIKKRVYIQHFIRINCAKISKLRKLSKNYEYPNYPEEIGKSNPHFRTDESVLYYFRYCSIRAQLRQL